MTNLTILPELKKLLPPLSDDEYAGLEKDIVERGCLSPIVVWNDVIVDGHNRYEICQKHGFSFEIKRLEFASLDDARFWAWTHQENRRNLTPYQRVEIAKQFKPMLAAKAKKNMSAGGGDQKSSRTRSGSTNLSNPIHESDTRATLAHLANVSEGTVSRVEFLDKHADEETKEQLRQGKTTINREYKRAKEKVADPKPKKIKTKKTDDKPVAEETPQKDEKSPSKNRTCIEELGPYVARTTLTNIRQDQPEHLLRNLASHFRKGYIEDLVLDAMEFLQEKHGSAVTTPIAEEIAKRYLKAKR